MRIRPVFVAIHLWVGVAAAPVLIVLGATGALLGLEDQITDRLDRAISVVRPQGTRRSIAEMLASVQRVYPFSSLIAAQLGPDADHAATLTVSVKPNDEPLGVVVDPYTARVLGTDAQRHTVFRSVRQLHRQLLAGERGSAIATWAAVALVILALTGPFVWWPRRRVGVRWSVAGWRRTLDVHAVLGACAWAFLLMLAITGAIVHWDRATQLMLGALTKKAAPQVPQLRVPPSCDVQAMLDADRLMAAGSVVLPGARPTALQLPNERGGVARLTFKFPEDHTPNGRSIVLLDACTGASLFAISTRTAPVAYLIPREWNREIHTGDVFGWPSRVLAVLAALCLPVMAISGPVAWLMRRRALAERRESRVGVRPIGSLAREEG